MVDVKDVTIQRLRSQLVLAFQLMTQYQRDRHKKISMKLSQEKGAANVLSNSGRPKKFKGYVPGQEKPVGEEYYDHA